MTNYEAIKHLTVDAMAELLDHVGAEPCVYCKKLPCWKKSGTPADSCEQGIKAWLESEVEVK